MTSTAGWASVNAPNRVFRVNVSWADVVIDDRVDVSGNDPTRFLKPLPSELPRPGDGEWVSQATLPPERDWDRSDVTAGPLYLRGHLIDGSSRPDAPPLMYEFYLTVRYGNGPTLGLVYQLSYNPWGAEDDAWLEATGPARRLARVLPAPPVTDGLTTTPLDEKVAASRGHWGLDDADLVAGARDAAAAWWTALSDVDAWFGHQGTDEERATPSLTHATTLKALCNLGVRNAETLPPSVRALGERWVPALDAGFRFDDPVDVEYVARAVAEDWVDSYEDEVTTWWARVRELRVAGWTPGAASLLHAQFDPDHGWHRQGFDVAVRDASGPQERWVAAVGDLGVASTCLLGGLGLFEVEAQVDAGTFDVDRVRLLAGLQSRGPS